MTAGALHAQENWPQIFRAQQTNQQASPPDSAGGGDTATERNFIDQLIAALESYSESGSEKFTFAYNFPDGTFGKLSGQARVIAQRPKLNEKLEKQEAEHAATLTALRDELEFGDDLTITFSISPQAREAAKKIESFLANNEPRQNALLTLRGAGTANISAARLAAQSHNILASLPSTEFSAFDDALRTGSMEAQRAVAQNAGNNEGPVFNRARVSAFLARELAPVVRNQSKFVFDASYRDRRETVGPKEWFVKTSYEYGPGTNIVKRANSITRKCNARPAELTADKCRDSYATAFYDASQSPTVQMGTRFAFALEYHDFSAVNLSRPELNPAVTFTLDSARSIVGSLSGGVDVFLKPKDPADPTKRERSGRLELSLSYDDVSGDKNRQDRLIGRLTYSQRMSENVFIPISLAYANHGDYLTNVDRKLNAHFGIAYKLPEKK
jgi:hypothetical protein